MLRTSVKVIMGILLGSLLFACYGSGKEDILEIEVTYENGDKDTIYERTNNPNIGLAVADNGCLVFVDWGFRKEQMKNNVCSVRNFKILQRVEYEQFLKQDNDQETNE